MLASFDSHLFWAALSSGPYWRGALLALELTAVSLATAIVIGFFVALGNLSPRRWVRTGAWTYNWLLRGTPTLLQLFIAWYALPQLWSGFSSRWWTPFIAAWICLSLNEGAYMSEIIRAGLLSVDRLSDRPHRAAERLRARRQILRRVIVPQAVRIAIPPTGNEFITLLKLTSLAYIISLHEILTAAQELAVVKFQYVEPLFAALLYYLAIVSVLMVLQSRLERRFTWSSARGRGRRIQAPAVPAIPHDAR